MTLAERLAGAAVRAGAGVEGQLVQASALSWLSRGPEADAILRDLSAATADVGLRRLGTASRMAAAAAPLPHSPRERDRRIRGQRAEQRMIAERLLVSVRTIEGHLYRAGHKLGISDRGAFASFVEPGASTEG
ncbi:MAG TPA: hypothetical protein VFQ19_09225 [Nocardioidaceae bacterium]|nr:hypothetical protein [Nocardioidaceae bacterium]